MTYDGDPILRRQLGRLYKGLLQNRVSMTHSFASFCEGMADFVYPKHSVSSKKLQALFIKNLGSISHFPTTKITAEIAAIFITGDVFSGMLCPNLI
ncbi:MAG: hypothetical protein HY474_00930 [Candidatus Sungbacteria bacterium]|uniref:Uncharacterized protein n=1 Tax=Candidatus Sungiibacteriota bacterium TaxID=2750080 RepID=A0A933DTQ3_9BACT|nr:hypothetical protein [Candidatus Sungbacteria bacterium]